MATTLIDEQLLKTYLQDWFTNTNLTTRNVWNQNPIASLIRQELVKVGKFKQKKYKNHKGNPISLPKPQQIIKPQIKTNDDW